MEELKNLILKRRPYECEQEYRVIWTGGASAKPPAIPIKDLIDYITLGPEFTKHAADGVIAMLKDRYKLEKTKHSRILEREDIITKFRNYKKA